MRSHWPAVLRAVLAVFCLATAAVAQDRATDTQDQAQPDGSSTPKKSAAAKPKTRRYASGRSTPADTAGTLASSSSTTTTAPKTEFATFGAGCFWHVEDTFEHLKGVKNAVSGYSGGMVAYPSYEMVHTGETGHAEVVQVEYDPSVVSYEQLLNVFWRCHDPTSINRQGEDEGPQYRSVILYHSEDQRKAALKSYQQLTKARVFRSPIVTQLVPMQAFFPAEDYHQNYYSGLRRTTTRRRRPAAATARFKPAPTKSKTAARPAQKPLATPAAAKDESAASQHDNDKPVP
ncbi:MAG: peptide-methionine (S)-S-oxide reductase MsrA [Isosphaeraceae bacterium]